MSLLRHLCPTLSADYVLENGRLRNCSGDVNNVAFFNGMIQFAQDEVTVGLYLLLVHLYAFLWLFAVIVVVAAVTLAGKVDDSRNARLSRLSRIPGWHHLEQWQWPHRVKKKPRLILVALGLVLTIYDSLFDVVVVFGLCEYWRTGAFPAPLIPPAHCGLVSHCGCRRGWPLALTALVVA